jgi:hypothetical protein
MMAQQWMRGGVVGTTRRRRASTPESERPLITLPRARDSYVIFDAHAFRNAMNVLMARARDPFTVLVMRPARPDTTLWLAELVIDQLRVGTGDLAGYLESAVAVVLHGASREGALRFRDRVRDAWRRSGAGELFVEMAEHPGEEQRTIGLLTTDWSRDG